MQITYRAYVGHGRFNEHLYKMHIISSPSHTYYNSSGQSLRHTFFDCSHFLISKLSSSTTCFNFTKPPLNIPHSLSDIIKKPECRIQNHLYTFVRSTHEALQYRRHINLQQNCRKKLLQQNCSLGCMALKCLCLFRNRNNGTKKKITN